MKKQEYDTFKARIKSVPANGAGMNGVIYDFVKKITKLHGTARGTPYLKKLLDDCGLDIPYAIVDALRSNTERLARIQGDI